MQTDFGFDGEEEKTPQGRLLLAVRSAVARISLKEVAYKLNVQPSLLADALKERNHKGVRAAWLVTILELADDADANAILAALAAIRGYEVKPGRKWTPEQLNERYEQKFLSMGPVGAQLIREVKEGR